MKYIAIALLALATCHAGTISTVGLEDWHGAGSDYDYNDVELQVTNVNFHALNPFLFVPPVGYSEIPFQGPAQHFDYGVAEGSVLAIFLSGQTSALDIPLLSVNGGVWLPILGSLLVPTAEGDIIRFGVFNTGQGIICDGVFASISPVPGGDPAGPEVPEPASVALIGGGLLALGLLRRRRG